ncbi:MAG: hypothetical protein H0V50_03610 [Thermoleophilaceae bacterium]|nr:hypothetical protein [Thermoleophilaceae bacterium]
MAFGFPRMDKTVLLGPDALARMAARKASEPEARWLLQQPRSVRAGYLRTVLGAEDEPNVQEVWMLRQPRGVRASYVRTVLKADDAPNVQEIWLLGQLQAVRESYIREVLGDGSARREK